MKKTLILICSLLVISILLFVILTKAEDKISEKDALAIGEEKYLEFLWMVDGAFNSEKLDGDFVVNGKILSDANKIFTCTYKNKNDDNCVGNNFESEFKKLFADNITYNDVYSDDDFYTWIKYENGKYIFHNLDNCNVTRMNLEQTITLESISNDKLVFFVIHENKSQTKIRKKDFVLIKENDDWKVSKAYYHDICELDYYIE